MSIFRDYTVRINYGNPSKYLNSNVFINCLIIITVYFAGLFKEACNAQWTVDHVLAHLPLKHPPG